MIIFNSSEPRQKSAFESSKSPRVRPALIEISTRWIFRISQRKRTSSGFGLSEWIFTFFFKNNSDFLELTEKGKQKFEEAQKELNTKFQEIVVPFYNTLVSIEFEKLTPDEYFSLMAENDLP